MLEKTRKRGASILIYLVFGTLIVVFVINFGPQSQGSSQGCGGGGASAPLTVGDVEVPKSSYLFLYQGFYRDGSSADRAAAVFSALTRREILAQEAEERGMRVSDELVDDQIKQGNLYYLLRRESLKPGPGQENTLWYPNGFFDYKSFRRWVSDVGLSVGSYRSVQKREMLAVWMAEQIRGSAQASRDEALAEYMYENNTVTFDAVKFSPSSWESAIKLTDGDIARFATAHAAEIEAKYKTDERFYKGMKPQLQLRWIQVAKAEPPKPPDPGPGPGSGSDAGSAAGSGSDAGSGAGSGSGGGSGSGSGATPVIKDDNRDKLVAARADILAKKKSFVDLAKTMNKDDADRANAGMRGWVQVDAPKLGDPALNEAVKALEVGGVSEVITTSRGHYLLTAEAKREGDLAFDAVKHEIAAELAKDLWSKEAAKRAALVAIADARGKDGKGGKNLDEMYEKTKRMTPPGPITDPRQLTPEQIEELLKQQLPPGAGESGAITIESPDIPARWGGGSDDGSAGGAGSGSGSDATGSGTVTGTGTGTGTGSGAGGGGGGGGGPTPDPGPSDVPLEPSKDTLPAFGDVAKPTVTRLGPIPKTRGELGEIGTSKELVDALFDPELAPGMLGEKVYVVGEDYVIVQIADKKQPVIDDFEADAEHQIQLLRDARGAAALRTWLKTRCDALAKAGEIEHDARLLQQTDDKGNEVQITFDPCAF